MAIRKFVHPMSKLTLTQISDELEKITDPESGFHYFFMNYIYMQTQQAGGKLYMKDNAYRWQEEATFSFLKKRHVVFKKMRQVSASTTTMAYALWRALFFNSQDIYFLSLSQRESTSMLKKLKFMYNHLPAWMKQPTKQDAATTMTFEHNNSQITSLPHSSNPVRSESASLVVLDECAFYKNMKDVLSAAVPATATGALIQNSHEALFSQIFYISTYPHTNIIDNDYIRILNLARDNVDGNYQLIEVFTDDIPFYQTESWHKEQLDILGAKRYAIEVKGEEPIDSDNVLLPVHVLQELKANPPIRCDFLFPDDVDEEGYYKDLNSVTQMRDEFDIQFHYIKGLWIWEEPKYGVEYIVTCDVAKGVDNDASAFQIFNLETMVQVAEFRNDRVDLETYKKIIEVVSKFYNKAKLSIENNGLGVGVVEYFENVINYENFYFHKHSKKKYIAGFPMGTITRSQAIVNMQSLLSNKEITINSQRTINELRNFGYSKTGKIKALGSGNDDLVLALAQFSYLVNIGWAVSTKSIVGESAMSIWSSNPHKKDDDEETQPIDKTPEEIQSEENKKRVLKYWEEKFDMAGVDDEKKEILKQLAASGYSIDERELETFLEN